MKKITLIAPVIIVLVLVFFLKPTNILAGCTGRVQCYYGYDDPIYFNHYCDTSIQLGGGGTCTNQSSASACSAEEASLISGCPDPQCSGGACNWSAPPPATPTPTPGGGGGGGPTNTPTPIPPTGCTTGNWSNIGCGLGGCLSNQIYQTRTVSPAGCASTTQCLNDPSCSTPPPSCTAGAWSNSGCGLGGCPLNKMYQTRTTNPLGCTINTQCVDNNTCLPPTGCSTGAWASQGCGLGGCASTKMYQTRTAEPAGCAATTQCIDDSSCVPLNCTVGAWASQGCGLGGCSAGKNYQTRTVSPAGCAAASQCIDDPSCTGGCSAGAWTYVGCGQGGCAANQMYQTRTVNPIACTYSSQCVNDATCVPAPTCTVNSANISLTIGQTLLEPLLPGITPLNGYISKVVYTVPVNPDVSICTNDGNASVPCPAGLTSVVVNILPPPASPTWGFKITAYGSGSVNITVNAVVTGTSSFNNCTPNTIAVEAKNIPPWWQTAGGDVISGGGSLRSMIGTTCTSAVGCYPFLIMNKISAPYWSMFTSSGIASVKDAGSGGTFSLPTVPGSISSEQWNVKNTISDSSTQYNYDYFHKKVPAGSIDATINTVNATAKLQGACTTSINGYCIYQSASTDLNICDSINVGTNKVILFVPGDVLINSCSGLHNKINLTKGKGFFMLIAGGDITVGPYVGAQAALAYPPLGTPSPDLEGIYFADGAFITQSNRVLLPTPGDCNDNYLQIRGMVVNLANGGTGIDLKRCLKDNSKSPAELFEYAPDIYLRFPSFLGKLSVEWNEVQP